MTYGSSPSSFVRTPLRGLPAHRGIGHLLKLCEQIQECIANDEFHDLYPQSMGYLEQVELSLRSCGEPGLQRLLAAHDAFHESFINLTLDAAAGKTSPSAVGEYALQW